MSVLLISLEARALSNHRSIFFSDTYQPCVSHKSGNKSNFKLNLLTWNPMFLHFFIYVLNSHCPLLTRIECTTHSKLNNIFIHRSCYVNILIQKKLLASYGQYNYQFSLFSFFCLVKFKYIVHFPCRIICQNFICPVDGLE